MLSSMSAERVIGAALGLFTALFAIVRANRSAAFDLAITLKLQERETPALGTLMRAASWPGFPPQSRLIPPAIMAAWWLAGRRRAAAFQAGAWGGALLSTAIKAAIRRPRPLPPEVRVVVAPLGGSSFPSGHVLTYVGTYGFMAFLAATLMREPRPRRAIVGSLVGLIALVGPSRIQQGHHWPTDVTASYFLGTSYLVLVTKLYRRLKARSAGVAP